VKLLLWTEKAVEGILKGEKNVFPRAFIGYFLTVFLFNYGTDWVNLNFVEMLVLSFLFSVHFIFIYVFADVKARERWKQKTK